MGKSGKYVQMVSGSKGKGLCGYAVRAGREATPWQLHVACLAMGLNQSYLTREEVSLLGQAVWALQQYLEILEYVLERKTVSQDWPALAHALRMAGTGQINQKIFLEAFRNHRG